MKGETKGNKRQKIVSNNATTARTTAIVTLEDPES